MGWAARAARRAARVKRRATTRGQRCRRCAGLFLQIFKDPDARRRAREAQGRVLGLDVLWRYYGDSYTHVQPPRPMCLELCARSAFNATNTLLDPLFAMRVAS